MTEENKETDLNEKDNTIEKGIVESNIENVANQIPAETPLVDVGDVSLEEVNTEIKAEEQKSEPEQVKIQEVSPLKEEAENMNGIPENDIENVANQIPAETPLVDANLEEEKTEIKADEQKSVPEPVKIQEEAPVKEEAENLNGIPENNIENVANQIPAETPLVDSNLEEEETEIKADEQKSVPEPVKIQEETPVKEEAENLNVIPENNIENVENQIPAETPLVDANLEEEETEIKADEQKSVPEPVKIQEETPVKEEAEKPAETVEKKPEYKSEDLKKVEKTPTSGNNDDIKKQLASYAIPAVSLILVAIIFFVLGRQTNRNDVLASQTTDSKANSVQKESETPDFENLLIVEDNAKSEEDNVSETVSEEADTLAQEQSLDRTAPWQKKSYSAEELEYLKEYYKKITENEPLEAIFKDMIFTENVADMEGMIATGLANSNFLMDNALTPLHFAIAKSNYDMCRMLIAYGADLNYSNSVFPTPLLLAIANNEEDLGILLLNSGADPEKKYKRDGVETPSPFEYAKAQNMPKLADLIQKKIEAKKAK